MWNLASSYLLYDEYVILCAALRRQCNWDLYFKLQEVFPPTLIQACADGVECVSLLEFVYTNSDANEALIAAIKNDHLHTVQFFQNKVKFDVSMVTLAASLFRHSILRWILQIYPTLYSQTCREIDPDSMEYITLAQTFMLQSEPRVVFATATPMASQSIDIAALMDLMRH